MLRCEMTVDRNTGMPKGFGFVSYDNAASADAAIGSINSQTIDGKTFRIEKTQEDAGPAMPRPAGGGF